jgi:hypothetical protein
MSDSHDEDDTENVRMTMTISQESADWLLEMYPEALELTEAVRMAITDARKLDKLRNRVQSATYEDANQL